MVSMDVSGSLPGRFFEPARTLPEGRSSLGESGGPHVSESGGLSLGMRRAGRSAARATMAQPDR